MSAATKFLTPGGGGVILTPASSIASDVTLQMPSENTTLAGQTYVQNYTQGIGFKNRIINGLCAINQRGAPATLLNVPQYFIDRWNAQVSSTGTAISYSAGQGTDGTISQYGPYHMYMLTGTAKPVLNSTDYGWLVQYIEGNNFSDFKFGTSSAKSFTFSFRAVASANMTVSVAFQNAASTRTYVTTVNVTTTPTNFSITVPGDTTGTWATDNTNAIGVIFTFAGNTSGARATSTLNAWQSGNYAFATTQSNGFDTNGKSLGIADVQLEKGTAATQFGIRPYGTELALCQRYYEICDLRRMAGVTYTPNGDTRANYQFKVTKRATPTLTQSGSLNVIAFGAVTEAINTDLGTISLSALSGGVSFGLSGASNSSAFSGCGAVISWGDNGGGGFTVYASAEL